LIRYHASWILPIAEPPIRDGWIVTDRDRIVAYGAYGAVTRRAPSHAESREVDLGQVAVLPGLVNAHTHLELSYLRDEVPPASGF
jgi:5-methylthioadenosine/S-adenosylhomocysteine deaminase